MRGWVNRNDWMRLLRLVADKPVSKYHAIPATVDDRTFASKREAARYQELKLLQAAGVISDLEIHPKFSMMVPELYRDPPPHTYQRSGTYTADFRYRENGQTVVEDVKSPPTRTEAYRLRKRHVQIQYGITIREIE